jgi:hypothetical protein
MATYFAIWKFPNRVRLPGAVPFAMRSFPDQGPLFLQFWQLFWGYLGGNSPPSAT